MVFINAKAQTEFKISGKPTIRFYNDFRYVEQGGKSKSSFNITRAQLGYGVKFSKHISGKVIFDVTKSDNLAYTGYLRNAMVTYKNEGLKINVGMIGTTMFKVPETNWGYRYIEKSFNDLYKFSPSVDLGVNVNYKFNKYVELKAALLNGEGSKKFEQDSTLKASLGLLLKPLEGLEFYSYIDRMDGDETQTSIVNFIGYSHKKFRIGAEYNIQKNNKYKKDHDLMGYSIYATYNYNKKLKFFGRFDELSSNKLDGEDDAWNIKKDGQLFMAGISYEITKGVKISPNYRYRKSASKNIQDTKMVFFNLEVKF